MSVVVSERAAAAEREAQEFLRDFLPENWTGLGALDSAARATFLAGWRSALVDANYLVPAWPRRFGGRDADLGEQMAIARTWIRGGVPPHPSPNDPFGLTLLGPTLLRWGTDDQQERYLPATVSGQIRWAQGYSEPEAGSDLFGLRTRAVPTDDGWRVTGQKLWQTAGTTADHMFLLARTDPDAAGSKGLSFMLLDLDQPEVEVRGIDNVLGEAEFAEVYLSDALVRTQDVVGPVNSGAQVALTLLGYERALNGYTASLGYEAELHRAIELARAQGRLSDTHVQEQFARCGTTVRAIGLLSQSVLTALAAGRTPGPESSVIKLLTSEYRQRVTVLAMDLLGADALAPTGIDGVYPLGPQPRDLDPASPLAWTRDYFQARPGTVYGGSSQIQRNTIGEQVLGLPREPRAARSSA